MLLRMIKSLLKRRSFSKIAWAGAPFGKSCRIYFSTNPGKNQGEEKFPGGLDKKVPGAILFLYKRCTTVSLF